jgi:Heterokaryon incompatibility protein (HET)
MDHLCLPQDPDWKNLEVPLFSEEPYDCGPFLTYPDRYPGTIFRDPSADDNTPTVTFRPAIEACRQYQQWLFFGLLHEFLQDLFIESEYVSWSEDGNAKVVTTKSLLPTLETWLESDALRDIALQDPSFSHFAECLSTAADMLSSVSVVFSGLEPQFAAALDSIASVGELLGECLRWYDEKIGKEPAFEPGIPWLSISALDDKKASEKRDAMRAVGWCPNDIHRVFERFQSVSSRSFFENLRLSSDVTRHTACSPLMCGVHDTTNVPVQPRHVEDYCACRPVGIPNSDLTSIYRDALIPCLTIHLDEEADEYRFAISQIDLSTRASGSVPYAALSHVWSEGLGNSTANSLPRCQLQHLHTRFKRIFEHQDPQTDWKEINIWIDTICCPVERGEGKSLALSRMREIYQNALFVIVIDASLQNWQPRGNVGDGTDTEIEMAARIFLSPWMRRLWTAQEAVMASFALETTFQPVWFQFGRTRLVELPQIISALRTEERRTPKRIAVDMLMQLTRLQGKLWYGNEEVTRHPQMLVMAQQMLQYRFCSVATDEILVLAALFGFDVQELIGVDFEDAMAHIWRRVPEIPGGLSKYVAFCRTPKLRVPGFRWAPRTFMDSNRSSMYQYFQVIGDEGSGSRAHLTPDGLEARLPGYIVRPISRPRSRCLLGRGDDCREGAQGVCLRMRDSEWRLIQSDDEDQARESRNLIDTLYYGNSAVLHSASLDGRSSISGDRALLVSVTDKGSHLCARIEYPVRYNELRPGTQKLYEIAYELCLTLDNFGDVSQSILDSHVHQMLTEDGSLARLIKVEEREEFGDIPELSSATMVSKVKDFVHHVGHVGNLEVEYLPDDQVWRID